MGFFNFIIIVLNNNCPESYDEKAWLSNLANLSQILGKVAAFQLGLEL